MIEVKNYAYYGKSLRFLSVCIMAIITMAGHSFAAEVSDLKMAEAFRNQINSIVIAADQLAMATGSYVGGGVSTDSISKTVFSGILKTAWGSDIQIANVTDTTFEIDVSHIIEPVCQAARPKLLGDPRLNVNAGCTAIVVSKAT